VECKDKQGFTEPYLADNNINKNVAAHTLKYSESR
jgi:hypothetical protein